MSFVLVLTQRRILKGLSKAALGRLAAVDPSRLSKIEAARIVPYPPELRRLASALGLRKQDFARLLCTVLLPNLC